jgi:hypothetical protein
MKRLAFTLLVALMIIVAGLVQTTLRQHDRAAAIPR